MVFHLCENSMIAEAYCRFLRQFLPTVVMKCCYVIDVYEVI